MILVSTPMVEDGYEWVNALDREDYEVFYELDGSPRAATWRPIRVRRVPAELGKPAQESDFPWLASHALVLRRRAWDVLADLIGEHAERLPLEDVDGAELFVLNVKVVDALDEARSRILKFPGSNRIMRISQAAFREELIRGRPLFRVPHRATPTYVSEEFVERVRISNLRGLRFERA